MSDIEQRTRELAYQIWESEGRPEGQEQRHWEMATRLLHSEQQGELQPAPKKKAAPRKPRGKAGTVPADETQLEKPALLGKPAARSSAKARKPPVTRTTKIKEPKSDADSAQE